MMPLTEQGQALETPYDYQPVTSGSQDRSTDLTGWPGAFVKLKHRSKIPDGARRIETEDPAVASDWLNAGGNVGLVPGDELIVVDVDPRNGGDETLRNLVADHGSFPKTVMTVTGGNGLHAFYKWPTSAGNPRGKLGKGIDIKHGANAHVVAPGSVHPETGRVYTWRSGCSPSEKEIAHCPRWLVEKQEQPARLELLPGIAPDFGTVNLTVGGMDETPENIALIRSALTAISADCDYQTWRDVSWGVMATGWPCAESLVREWSLTVPERFDGVAFNQVVESFKPGGIGVGTVFHLAAQAGWKDPRKTITSAVTGSGDLMNARLLAERLRGKFLYIPETGKWVWFDPFKGWGLSHYGLLEQAAKALVDELLTEARRLWAAEPDSPRTKKAKAHVERSSHARALRDMLELMKSEPGMANSLNEFDSDPMLLGVANGVLNLRTRNLLAPDSSLLVSKRAAVAFDPSATCPLFDGVMSQIQPDAEIRGFLQRWCGYCLTGLVNEQAFMFAFGTGRNGKSLLIELVAWLLGDYARKIPTELLMAGQRDPNAPAPEIVGLKGLRFVYTSETEEGQRLAAARVKELTGGDTLTGRVPYAAQAVTFSPSHKLMVVGNHKPEIRDDSFGMWRRVLLVPFAVTIPEEQVDASLPEKLRTEAAGILNWCLAGLAAYRRDGLQPPAIIKAAVASYKDEQDILGEWLQDHCEVGASYTASKQETYRAYRSWCATNGHGALSANKLGRRLAERGFTATTDKRGYKGLKLSPDGIMASTRIL